MYLSNFKANNNRLRWQKHKIPKLDLPTANFDAVTSE